MTDEDKNESADETVQPLSRREKLLALFDEWDKDPLSDKESAAVSAVIESFRDNPFVLRDLESLLDTRFPPKPAALKVTRSVEYGVQNSIGGGYTTVTAASEEEAVREYCRLTGLTSGSVTVIQLPQPWPCHLDTKYTVESASPAVVPDAVRKGGWPQPRWKRNPPPVDRQAGPALSKHDPVTRLRVFNILRDEALIQWREHDGLGYSAHASAFLNNSTIGKEVTNAQIAYMAILSCGAYQGDET